MSKIRSRSAGSCVHGRTISRSVSYTAVTGNTLATARFVDTPRRYPTGGYLRNASTSGDPLLRHALLHLAGAQLGRVDLEVERPPGGEPATHRGDRDRPVLAVDQFVQRDHRVVAPELQAQVVT